MTAVAVVAGRAGGRGGDGVDHGGGLVRLTRGPDGDQDDDCPAGELPAETAGLVVVSATSHVIHLLGASCALCPMELSMRRNHHELPVHSQCTTNPHSAVTVHFALETEG